MDIVHSFVADHPLGKLFGRVLLRAVKCLSGYQVILRAFHRFLKLSRTFADLAGSDDIEAHHLAEGLQNRPIWTV